MEPMTRQFILPGPKKVPSPLAINPSTPVSEAKPESSEVRRRDGLLKVKIPAKSWKMEMQVHEAR